MGFMLEQNVIRMHSMAYFCIGGISLNSAFHAGNRSRLYDSLPDGTIALFYSGLAPRKTGEEKYPFFASRNFVYLTGITREDCVLMAVKGEGKVQETLFILPPDPMAERWHGVRLKPEEATAISGIGDIAFRQELEERLHRLLRTGRYPRVALDLYRFEHTDADSPAVSLAHRLRRRYPAVEIVDASIPLRRLRVIKQPCEIEAMRQAALITRAGIVAMMKASRPGMYEYQYKAEFDYALAQHGVLVPGFPSIISAGANNFCIHYDAYTGQAQDGDMVLNDVGAVWDGMINDVSRAWPCNGKFSQRQRLLYTCALNTSRHMFSIIRPGMPMADVDRLAREYNFTQLRDIGVCERYEDIGKYMWHGGAHHVGYDVHDFVEADVVSPGMVFCVDIGIYCEEWGIGFRLEDNCHVTENGCENLTACVPSSIEEIEAIMAGEAD